MPRDTDGRESADVVRTGSDAVESLLRRLWRRRKQTPRIVLIEEDGTRTEYTFDPNDPILWRGDGDYVIGCIALSEKVDLFIGSHSDPARWPNVR